MRRRDTQARRLRRDGIVAIPDDPAESSRPVSSGLSGRLQTRKDVDRLASPPAPPRATARRRRSCYSQSVFEASAGGLRPNAAIASHRRIRAASRPLLAPARSRSRASASRVARIVAEDLPTRPRARMPSAHLDGPLVSGPSRHSSQPGALLRHRLKLGLVLAAIALIAVYQMGGRRAEPILIDPGPASSLEARLNYIAARRRAAVRKPVKRIWQIHLGKDDSRTQAFQWSWRIHNPGWRQEVRHTSASGFANCADARRSRRSVASRGLRIDAGGSRYLRRVSVRRHARGHAAAARAARRGRTLHRSGHPMCVAPAMPSLIAQVFSRSTAGRPRSASWTTHSRPSHASSALRVRGRS